MRMSRLCPRTQLSSLFSGTSASVLLLAVLLAGPAVLAQEVPLNGYYDGTGAATHWVTSNPLQIAILRWYPANQSEAAFSVGTEPIGVAFDGANIWVTNYGSNNVTKLRASDGGVLGTFSVGTHPYGVAFDGANIWVANSGGNNVTKL